MSESKPRDLTRDELALIQTPASRGAESAPLRIPPGTETPIELWNPAAAESSAAAAPSTKLGGAVGAESSVTTPGAIPTVAAPSTKLGGAENHVARGASPSVASKRRSKSR
jgi:hypothetical protein